MIWKDTTGYSRGAERIPTTWTADLGDLSLTVTSGHIYFKGEWIVQCEPFFRERQLGVETKDAAQEKAIEMVRGALDKIMSALPPGNRRSIRAEIIEECAKEAEKHSAQMPHDHDFYRGYACGRGDAAKAIRALVGSQQPQGTAND